VEFVFGSPLEKFTKFQNIIKNVSKQREKRHYTNNNNNTTTKLTLTMLPTINRTIAASIWFVAGACTSTVIMFGSVVAMTMIFAWSVQII